MLDPSDAPTQRSQARLGKVLRDKWRIDQLIGVGGMAAVYAATHVKNGRRVALKVLHPEASMAPDTRARFLREGYAANKLEHPGTVAVLDDDVAEDGSVFLVMELLQGETLEDRREQSGGRLRIAEALEVCAQVLDVLVVAHDKGVVHRDLKPDNIFLCAGGVVKVLDFGIARVREPLTARHTMTNAGTMGTPGYMPPEQARGRWDDVGPRSDLWALGATLFTVMTGSLVHEAETTNELLLAAMTRAAPPLASRLPDAPPAVATLIDRALAREPEARWSDARAMQQALHAARASLGAAVVRGPGGTERPPHGALAPPHLAPTPPRPALVPAPSPPSPVVPAVQQREAWVPSVPQRESWVPSVPQRESWVPSVAQPYPVPAARPVLGPGSPGLATGHPVTMNPALAPARPAPRAAKQVSVGLLLAAVSCGGVVMGAILWLVLGRLTPVAPPDAPPEALPAATMTAPLTSAADPALPPPTEPAPSGAAPPVSADPAAPPSASAPPSTSARPPPSSTPPGKKPGTKSPSVQDLLNRRR